MTKNKDTSTLGKINGNYPTMKETGEFIRHAREAHGISQETLGNRIFVTRKAVSKWETGVGYPSVEILAPLAETLNISIDEMLIGKFNNNESIFNQNKLLSYVLKIAKRKYVKRLAITVITSLFILLASFFFANYNKTKVYNVYYEDAEGGVYIKNGLAISTPSKEYINIGYVYNDYDDVDDDTIINYTLYYGDSNHEEQVLMSFGSKARIPYLANTNYEEIPRINLDKNLDKLYLRVNYKNKENKNKTFTVRLNVKLNYQNNDFLNIKKKMSKDYISYISNNENKTILYDNKKIKERKNIGVLYEYSEEMIDKKFNKKIFIKDNNKYMITIYKKIIKIGSKENKIEIDLNNRNIHVFSEKNNKRKTYQIDIKNTVYFDNKEDLLINILEEIINM